MSTDQTRQVDQGPEAAAYCEWHPGVETRLSCSQCGRSICTQCMVQAPVGIRCRECGRAVRMPTFDVQPTHYLRGFAVAGLVGLGGGFAWWLYNLFVILLFDGRLPVILASLPAVAIGYASGELTSRSVNRKRSPLLSLAAGVSVVVAYVLTVAILNFFSLYTLLFIAAGVYIAMQKLR